MEGLNLAFYIGIGFLQQNGLVVAAIILSLVVLYAIIAVLKLLVSSNNEITQSTENPNTRHGYVDAFCDSCRNGHTQHGES
ncbi:hypothetical protein P8S54_05095 [Thiomicrospira sp. R3]|uniref:hypothetical protein n=1 Tax=Thiomicrospira sp. R3 TaxID=3035472 RepID=UPI00259B7F60|nr:hypothetical protein [Thiomicrospira sp. R3]WFE69680.1 hypothetical protein P8S54_05095 [Thiomicrospira sp. R3]